MLSTHDREMTACAMSNGRFDVALISDEMTLSKYCSTGNRLMAHILPPSASDHSVPWKVCRSLRSQWKLTPIVTSSNENDADAATGLNISSVKAMPSQCMSPWAIVASWAPST